jgi:hypothetical protein
MVHTNGGKLSRKLHDPCLAKVLAIFEVFTAETMKIAVF